jgi:FkbM family methyltransferase
MLVSSAVRALNLLNPTSHGRLWLQSVAERRGRPPSGVYRVIGGALMDLDTSDFLERSLYYRTFEFLITRTFRRYIKPGFNVADIGANVGFYSLLMSRLVGDRGKVRAFEPNPRVYQRLLRNLSLNNAKNVTPHQLALSESEGEISLHLPPLDTHGLASLRNQGWKGGETVQVATRRLDDFLSGERVDVIKVDVEGAELLVLKGAEKTITEQRPCLLLEFNPRVTQSFGYSPVEIARLVMRYHPKYTIRRIDPHHVAQTSLSEIEKADTSLEGYYLFTMDQKPA